MDAVLRFLTQPCQQPVNIENHEAKLVDTTGEPVKISIQMLDTNAETHHYFKGDHSCSSSS